MISNNGQNKGLSMQENLTVVMDGDCQRRKQMGLFQNCEAMSKLECGLRRGGCAFSTTSAHGGQAMRWLVLESV
jgi:hypothetical protein